MAGIALGYGAMNISYFTRHMRLQIMISTKGERPKYRFSGPIAKGESTITGGAIMDKGPADPKIKEKVLAYLDTIEKAKSKEIAKAIDERKGAVDLAIKELAEEDLVEYLYITTTFVALKGKVAPPE